MKKYTYSEILNLYDESFKDDTKVSHCEKVLFYFNNLLSDKTESKLITTNNTGLLYKVYFEDKCVASVTILEIPTLVSILYDFYDTFQLKYKLECFMVS